MEFLMNDNAFKGLRSKAQKLLCFVVCRSDNYGKTYVDQSDKFDKHVSLRSYYTCPNNKSKVTYV